MSLRRDLRVEGEKEEPPAIGRKECGVREQM